jgi:hypothetical protein
MVQAKDKSGNPVTMLFIGPNSATELITVGSNDQASDSVATSAGTPAGAMFTSLPAEDELSSKGSDLDVYNNANLNIGKIKDVAYNGTSVNGYVIGVGGFLGMAISTSRSDCPRSSSTMMPRTRSGIQAWMPTPISSKPLYKYPSNS